MFDVGGNETRLHRAEGAQPKLSMERGRAKLKTQPQQSRSIPSLKIKGSFVLLLGHIALCAFFCPLPSAAQGQSAIQMMVHDEAGKSVSNVEAHLKRNGEDVRVAVTNEQGEIVFPGLSPDEYELMMSKRCFESLAQFVVIDPHRTAEIEITTVLAPRNGQKTFLSYVRSRAHGDLNDFSRYLGDFPCPVVQSNQFTELPGNLPNRFLAWGFFPLPWKMQLAPIVEYHTGFTYAPADAARNCVGVPYSDRFRYPKFFSADARVSKDVKINEKYSLRFSRSVLNMTNHFNALDLHANTGDPQYGVFFGNYKRLFRGDFDVLF